MTRGETVRVLVDYDLYGVNINDEKGVYLKTDVTTGKHLVYFKINGEWAELGPDQIKRTRPNYVSKKNQEFINNIKTMVTTYGT